MSDLREAITKLYETQVTSKPALPFVGEDYISARAEAFRCMVVGLNAYLAPSDFEGQAGDSRNWCSSWWQNLTHTFYAEGRVAAWTLSEALTKLEAFRGLNYEDSASSYFMNFIPRFLTEAEGKTSSSVPKEAYANTGEIWSGTLDLLAQNRVFPHAILLLGKDEATWNAAWPSLHPKYSKSDAYKVVSILEAVPHRSALVEIEIGELRHPVFLFRGRHPAAKSYGSPAGDIYTWLRSDESRPTREALVRPGPAPSSTKG